MSMPIKHTILMVTPGYSHNWKAEPHWYREAFENAGHTVVQFVIPFRHSHRYAPWPSASRVLRYRLNRIIEDKKPHIAFIIHGGGYWTVEMLDDLQSAGIYILYYNPDDPMLFSPISSRLAPYCHTVLSFPKVIRMYREKLNIAAHPFLYCVDPEIENGTLPAPDTFKKYRSDIVFTGFVDTLRKRKRAEFLYRLHAAGIGDVAYYGPLRPASPDFIKEIHCGENIDNKANNMVIRSSKIVFHYTQEMATGEQDPLLPDNFQSVSGRIFDGAAAGCLVMTNNFADLDKAFEPGKEVIVYDDIDDAVEKADYYLRHEDQRKIIAEAGRKRAMSEHCASHRVRYILNLLETGIQLKGNKAVTHDNHR